MAKVLLGGARSSYHHGNLEEELIQVALSLISVHGAENFSLRSLAGEIGVSPSAVYHYYPDKESLVGSLCEYLFNELANIQERAISKIPGRSAKSAKLRFRAIGESYFKWATKEPHLFTMMFSGRSPKVKNGAPADNRAFQMLTESLDELLEFGVLDPAVRPYAELIAWSAVQGATTLIVEGLIAKDQFQDLLDGLEIALSKGR